MSSDPILYTNPQSRGRIARWMLEETGAAYRTEWVDYGPDMRSESFRARNPMGKVPVVVHGDQTVTECAAICLYLADAFPEAALAPPPGRRGPYFRWIAFGAGPLEAAVTNRALGFEVPEDRRGFVGYGDFERVIDTLEAAVSAGPYLAGDRFSAADVYTGSQIGWGLRFGTLPDRPALRRYWERIADRPARIRAEAIDNARIEEQSA
jgi:glutathione S-transferase